jgi:hypothetical protein
VSFVTTLKKNAFFGEQGIQKGAGKIANAQAIIRWYLHAHRFSDYRS